MRFLEREVYTFAGSRRNAVGPHFLFMGGPQKATWTAGDGPAADGRHARRAAGRAIRKERHAKAREKREKRSFFFFSGERLEGCLLCPLGGGRDRAAAIAALGHRHCRENVACAGCGMGWSMGGSSACGGLWPTFQLIQLIYLRYLCRSVKREERMDVPVSPHFVYIVYHKIWRLSKMESGRKWKGWKNVEGAMLRKMDMREGVRGKEWKGG